MNLNSKNKVNPNFSMSSMTDLIFILLIFFLVTSNSMSLLGIDKPKAANPEEIENQDIIIVTIKKDILCETYQYILSNGYTCCGWKDAKIALSNFIQKINVDKEFSGIILSAEKNIPIDECVKLIDFASKYDYNIGIDVDKKKDNF